MIPYQNPKKLPAVSTTTLHFTLYTLHFPNPLHMKKHIILSALIILLATACSYFLFIRPRQRRENPAELFETQLPAASQAAKPESEEPEPAVERSGILNILLTGVDSKGSGTTSGTMPHADMNMLIAINFDDEKVDIISVPRDTFAEAEGEHSGYYKLNCIFNVGGGMQDPEAGCDYLRRNIEKIMGVSIPYYYALTFDALIELIDAVGGIDYEIDIPITSFDGTRLAPGLHHLDGPAAARYLETRLNVADGLDVSRTDRQRRFAVALFQKMKDEARLSSVPELISSVKKGFWTNTTLAQTAALANYSKDFNTENIRLHTVAGPYVINYTWGYNFIDQGVRQQLLKDVYGIDAEPLRYCTQPYERFLMDCGAVNLHWLKEAEKVLAFADASAEGYAACKAAHDAMLNLHTAMSDWQKEHYANSDYQAISEYNDLNTKVYSTREELRKTTEALAESAGYGEKLNWSQSNAYWLDGNVNDVYVDFA